MLPKPVTVLEQVLRLRQELRSKRVDPLIKKQARDIYMHLSDLSQNLDSRLVASHTQKGIGSMNLLPCQKDLSNLATNGQSKHSMNSLTARAPTILNKVAKLPSTNRDRAASQTKIDWKDDFFRFTPRPTDRFLMSSTTTPRSRIISTEPCESKNHYESSDEYADEPTQINISHGKPLMPSSKNKPPPSVDFDSSLSKSQQKAQSIARTSFFPTAVMDSVEMQTHFPTTTSSHKLNSIDRQSQELTPSKSRVSDNFSKYYTLDEQLHNLSKVSESIGELNFAINSYIDKLPLTNTRGSTERIKSLPPLSLDSNPSKFQRSANSKRTSHRNLHSPAQEYDFFSKDFTVSVDQLRADLEKSTLRNS